MVKQMLNTEYKETNEAMIEAITNDFLVGLSDDRMDDGVAIISTLVHCTNVLFNTEGDKKLPKTSVMSLKQRSESYADLVSIATEALHNPEGWTDRINAILDGMEAEEVNDDVVEEVNTEVVAPATTPVDVPDINALVVSAVAEATSGLMEQMQSMIASSAVPTAPAVEEPKVAKQPKVEPEAPSNPSGLDEKKSYGNPKGWSDKPTTRFLLLATSSEPTKPMPNTIFVCRGLTPEEATHQGRKVVLRRIIQTIDKVNGNKNLTKATQSEDWMAVTSDSFEITDAVLDSFLTNPNKFQQQPRRTG